MNFDEAKAYLDSLTRLGIKLGNERFEELLLRLGSPHRNLKALHIAGTKGKGSTAMFASSILRSAGYRVGTYLSPYVYDIRERVQIDGAMIPKEEFARIATEVRHISEEIRDTDHGPVTEFEFKTAVGFRYFAEQQVDYAVIEVGLGGRLDATNVLVDPIVCVITNIGYDHTNLLGNTLREIAGEKAGIIKRGGICVTGAQEPEALTRIREACRDQDAKIVEVAPGHCWQSEVDGSLSVITAKRDLGGLNLGVRGDFQMANAALAIHAIDNACDIEVNDDAVRDGLATARIPGRLETIRVSQPQIVVDAAHNELAARALSSALRVGYSLDRRPLILVVGMSKGHEADEFLAPLLEGLDLGNVTLIATEPEFRPREAEDVARAGTALGAGRVDIVKPALEAASRAIGLALENPDSLVVVTGSFFTIGELTPERWQELLTRWDLPQQLSVENSSSKDESNYESRLADNHSGRRLLVDTPVVSNGSRTQYT